MKLMARRKVEKSKRIKHTTWAHGRWLMGCDVRTPNLRLEPWATHVRVISCATLRKNCDVWGVLFTPYGFLKPHMPTSVSLPQALLRSLFPELSSTWCSAFRSRENDCKKTSRNSWCWTNEEDGSIHHAWNYLWLPCPQVVFWCRHFWFGSWI